MYQVNEALCRGCAACVKACPEDAIALFNDIAHIAADRCTNCGACAEVCPEGAIRLVEPVALARMGEPTLADSPAAQAGPPVIRVTGESIPATQAVTTWRSRLWPAIGGALAWAGRELLPELLAAWRESASSSPIKEAAEGAVSCKGCPGGRQARRRRRWGLRR
jgi:ferredoxin